jgi:hypothetical protein
MEAKMPDKYKRWRDMTRKQIITRLNRKYENSAGVPPSSIKKIVDRYMEKRKAERALRRKYTTHKDKWNTVITPLSKEINSVRTRVAQWEKRKSTELFTFFSAYLNALLKVRDILRAYQRQELDPDAKAKAVNLSDEGILPNSLSRLPLGQHWSDWVPHKIKREFMRAHSNLATRTRRLTLIFQREPNKTILDQHWRVRQMWVEELNQLQNTIDRDGTDRREYEVRQAERIRQAIAKLEAAPKDKRITPHWRKLVTAKEAA